MRENSSSQDAQRTAIYTNIRKKTLLVRLSNGFDVTCKVTNLYWRTELNPCEVFTILEELQENKGVKLKVRGYYGTVERTQDLE